MSKAPPKPTSQTCSGISVRIVGTSSSGIRPLCNLGTTSSRFRTANTSPRRRSFESICGPFDRSEQAQGFVFAKHSLDNCEPVGVQFGNDLWRVEHPLIVSSRIARPAWQPDGVLAL